MEILLGISLIILSLVALVTVIGLLGLKLFAQHKDKKIEITSDKDNFKN